MNAIHHEFEEHTTKFTVCLNGTRRHPRTRCVRSYKSSAPYCNCSGTTSENRGISTCTSISIEPGNENLNVAYLRSCTRNASFLPGIVNDLPHLECAFKHANLQPTVHN